MFGLLKKGMISAATSKQKKEMQTILDMLEVGSDREMGVSLGFTLMLVYGFCKQNSGFPEDYFLNGGVVADESKGEIHMQIVKFHGLRRSMSGNGLSGELVASALLIVICSLRGLCHVETFPLARKIWANLIRGKDYWKDVLIEYNSEKWNDESLEQVELYLNNIFVPE